MSKSKKSKEHLEERKTDDLMVNLLLPDRDIWKSWADIEKLSLPELENLIRALGAGMGLGGVNTINIGKMRELLDKRKRLLDSTFMCTEDDVEWEHLVWLANYIKERADKVREQGDQIYTQMRTLWQEENNRICNGFSVEIYLRIRYVGLYFGSGERFDECWEDTEKFWMAKLLNGVDEYYYWENLIDDYDRYYNGSNMYQGDKPFSEKNDLSEKEWTFNEFTKLQNLLCSRVLRDFPFSRELDRLLNSYYALEDLIHINNMESGVKVTWRE